jgi:hypothetical protein
MWPFITVCSSWERIQCPLTVNSGTPEEAGEGGVGEEGLPWGDEIDMVATINIQHEKQWLLPPQ